ncbi:MAG: glycosyltransferase family 2 protein [Candidatus Diapherotrites archaeon]|nr:glycosyltransferase family 2 protein [Candidatus Diapherotrites archaeon]
MGRLLLYGLMVCLVAFGFFVLGTLLWATGTDSAFLNSVFYSSSSLFLLAFAAAVVDLHFFRSRSRPIMYRPLSNPKISVGMTAYNDEGVIGPAVKDFLSHPLVCSVVVIDNNCTDHTAQEAKAAGAVVVAEPVQGYGAACKRALQEARKNGNLILLVEGDQTFSSKDIDKMVAYIQNADLVLGTRTTRELCDPDTQMNWFIQYGNIFIAKLIELRFWSRTRLTDVGCTLRLIRPEALDALLPSLQVTGNSFSPHMILQALHQDLKTLEIPVTFRKRGGQSKGVGSSYVKGLQTGLAMWKEILLS